MAEKAIFFGQDKWPDFSVVLVSDYESGEELSWSQLRETLRILAEEPNAEGVEFIFAESRIYSNRLPSDIQNILPGLKIVWSDATTHYELKNEGARAASADVVGFVDVDCLPERGWLTSLMQAFKAHPEVDIVAGRTRYSGRTFAERVFALTSRGYLDPGKAGETHTLGPNNCALRRNVLLKFPFRDDLGAFGEKLHAEDLRSNGHRIHFEPSMVVVHAHEGWDMERDIRRNAGYCTIMARRIDPRIGYSWLARLGPFTIPAFILARSVYDWRLILRLFRQYSISWYEIPVALLLSTYGHLLEIPGMLVAVRGEPLQTAYR